MITQRIGVLGCGVMGQGIARAAAGAGMTTILCKVTPGDLDQVKAEFMSRLEKSKLTPETKSAIRANLYWADQIGDLKDCDLVIESIVEDLLKKQDLFRQLDGIVKPEAIFASNTSTLSISDLANVTGRQDRFLALHFFNPTSAMHLVEVAYTKSTATSVVNAGKSFVHKVGKKPIIVGDDSPGFVVNRLLMNSLLYAIRSWEDDLASMEDIDQAIKLGLRHPMGPFTLCDFIGLDVVLAMSKNLCSGLKDKCFAPRPSLRRLVSLGMLGKKTEKGFYDYTADPARPNNVLSTFRASP